MAAISMSEDDLLVTVLDMAKRMGVMTAHFRAAQSKTGRWITPVQGDGKGFPDVVLVGHGGLLFRELKSAKGRLAPEQQLWLDALTTAGGDADVWRPADLTSGRIEAEIRAVRRPSTAKEPCRA